MIHKGLVDHPLVSDILESHHFVYNSLIGVEFLGRVFFFDRVNFCYIYYSKQNYFMFFLFSLFCSINCNENFVFTVYINGIHYQIGIPHNTIEYNRHVLLSRGLMSHICDI